MHACILKIQKKGGVAILKKKIGPYKVAILEKKMALELSSYAGSHDFSHASTSGSVRIPKKSEEKGNDVRKTRIAEYLIIKYAILTTVASGSSLLIMTILIPSTGITVFGSLNTVIDCICLVLMSHKAFDKLYKKLCFGAVICVKGLCLRKKGPSTSTKRSPAEEQRANF